MEFWEFVDSFVLFEQFSVVIPVFASCLCLMHSKLVSTLSFPRSLCYLDKAHPQPRSYSQADSEFPSLSGKQH